MSIRADVTTAPRKDKYPWIGLNRHNGRVVLFNKPNMGTVLSAGSTVREPLVGEYLSYWEESEYDPIESITLTNT